MKWEEGFLFSKLLKRRAGLLNLTHFQGIMITSQILDERRGQSFNNFYTKPYPGVCIYNLNGLMLNSIFHSPVAGLYYQATQEL